MPIILIFLSQRTTPESFNATSMRHKLIQMHMFFGFIAGSDEGLWHLLLPESRHADTSERLAG
jgi:hypothetical protein